MKMKTFAIFICLCIFIQFESGFAGRRLIFNNLEDAMDVTDFSVYYDINTNNTIKKMMPRPWYQPGWRLRLPFQGGKCTCDTFKCTCCSGMRVKQLGFDKQTCAELNFEPNEGRLGLNVRMSNETVLSKMYSVANPPPFCIPIPIPSVPIPLLDMCIRLFDITFDWNKMHVCMDWDTRIDKAPVVILHFDCMNLGEGGVTLTKPGSTHQGVVDTEGTTEPPQLNVDVYDPVTEMEDITTKTPLFSISNKYI